MTRNPGHLPLEAIGKRVRVRLRNGGGFEAPADGRGAPRWSLGTDPFDIVEYEVVA